MKRQPGVPPDMAPNPGDVELRGWVPASTIRVVTNYAIGMAEIADENARLAQEWQDKALINPLTGFGSRLALVERLQTNPQPRAVLVADLDWFGEINKARGMKTGDETITLFSTQIISKCLRPGDEAFSPGGDETVILLGTAPHESRRQNDPRIRHPSQIDRRRIGPEDLLELTSAAAESLFERIAQEPEYAYLDELGIGISFGGAVWQPGMTVDSLIAEADQNMQERKNAKLPVLTDGQMKIMRDFHRDMIATGMPARTALKIMKSGMLGAGLKF